MPEDNFLFPLPNNVRSLRSKRLLATGLCFVVVGMVCVVNASWATAYGAVKHYAIGPFFNTHWLNTVYLLVGFGLVSCELHRANFFLFLAMVLCITSLCMGLEVIVADCVNIQTVRQLENSMVLHGFSKEQESSALTYNVVDLICNVIAVALSCIALQEMHRTTARNFAHLSERSLGLFVCGVAMMLLGLAKVFAWVSETIWLHGDSNQTIRVHFLNYTFDEPVWALICAVCGVLVSIVGFNGNRVLLYVSLILTGLSYFPTFQYVWIDYRGIVQVQFSEIFVKVPKLTGVLWTNLVISILHTAFIVGTFALLVHKLSDHRVMHFHINLRVEEGVRRALTALPVLLIAIGLVFLSLDLANNREGTFFRLFYPTEQKLPFLLIPAGCILLLTLRDTTVRYLLFAIAFSLLLQCLQFCLFHIAAYFYLAYSVYFAPRLCDLFYYTPGTCTTTVERSGAITHFVEASLALAVLFMTALGSVLLARLMSLHALPIGQLSETHARKKLMCELLLMGMGMIQFILGPIVMYVIFSYKPGDDYTQSHPLFYLHDSINLACYCSPYLIIGGAQLGLTPAIYQCPLKILSVVVMNAVRIMDILMQLDYRNLTNSLNRGTTALFVAEMISMCIAFASVVVCGLLLDLTLNQLPQFDFDDDDLRTVENGSLEYTYADADGVAPHGVLYHNADGNGQRLSTPSTTIPPAHLIQNAELSNHEDFAVLPNMRLQKANL